MPPKEDLQFYIEQLEQIEKNLGLGALIFLILITIAFYLLWKFINKSIEKKVEETSEKTLKTYQSNIDKEFFKFQSMHQNQVDAIYKIYQDFCEMNMSIDFLINGENFSSSENPRDIINHIINLRHNFKKTFLKNKLLFAKDLCFKIESLIPKIDEFISTFSSGLFPEMSPEEKQMNADLNNGAILAGIWNSNAFGPLLINMSEISIEIEDEFRKIVGTN